MTETAKLPIDEFVEYLLVLGGDLLSFGCPTHRLEDVIRVVSRIEGYHAEVFAVPTGLFLSVAPAEGGTPLFRMIRVKEWGVNLERLAGADRIFNEVIEHKCTLREALDRLHALENKPPPYPFWLRWLAGAAATGAAAVFFRGGPWEVLVAAFGGLVLGLFNPVAAKNPQARLLADFVGGLFAASLAAACTWIRFDLSREVIVLATVIVNVPGMTLTTGLQELATKNLVSGASRLMEAMIIFLSILFGIALIVGIGEMVNTPILAAAPRVGMGLPVQVAAIVIASLAFGVLFSMPRRFLHLALLSGGVGWIATALGTRYLPGHLAAFTSALTLSLVANAFARVTARPSQLFLLPGLILLVPGSFGFLSLEEFLRGDFMGGASKGFEMFLIAGALVTGLLVANVVLPARKIL
ncbi:MAG TPA: threonine/serine exporter family protein [bacterium]|nr:threonine/serine exporter family protein [bacterium]